MSTQKFNLSDGNPDGTVLGQSSTDRINFYNTVVPVAQRADGRQSIIQAAQLGTILNFAANGGTLSATGANTAANQAITCTGMLATDFIIGVSKPTAQANLGVGAAYLAASDAADVQLATSNGSVTATADQQYSITALRGMNVITATLAPANVVTKTAIEQEFTLGGANAAANATVSSGGEIDYIAVSNQGNGQYSVPPTVTITPANGYGGYGATAKATVANGYVNSVIITNKGTGYTANQVTVSFDGGTVVSPGQVVVVSKAAYQANLVIGACRVTGRNKIAIPFGAVGAANITPTANETYKILALSEMSAVSPVIRIQANLANFTAAAANTSNKTAIAVVGIAATDTVLSINPPSLTSPELYGAGFCAANSITVTYGGGVPGVTPANGVYQLNILQQAQAAPVQIYSIPVTPVAIGANTAAELVVTLPSNITIPANTTVIANPTQALPNGVLLMGARANSTTTIGLNIMNVSNASVTPANQNFLIAVCPSPVITIGANQIEGFVATQCGISVNRIMELQNELQQSLVSLGLINGA